jgi:tetratricopeptide (TPR) repeat protein
MRGIGESGLRRAATAAAAACVMLALVPQAFAQDPEPEATGEDVGAFLASAQTAIAEGRHEDAKYAIDRAMSLRTMSPRELGAALYLHGQARYALGEVREAMADWRRALDEGALSESQAEALQQGLARLEAYLEDEERGGDAGLAASHLQRADDALAAGDYARAHDLATRALAEAEASGDPVWVLEALGRLGIAASRVGEFDAAFATFERAAAAANDQQNVPAHLMALISKGEAAMAADRTDVAADAYRRGIEIGERLEDDAGMMERIAVEHAHAALGHVALSNREYADADRYLSRALELGEDRTGRGVNGKPMPPFEMRATILANAALVALLRGDAAQADGRLDQLRREAAEWDEAPIAARMIEHASEFARYLGDQEVACALERRSRDLYAELGLRDDADDMRIIMEEAGCLDPALPIDPE